VSSEKPEIGELLVDMESGNTGMISPDEKERT
jgi:hypothetical protein